MTALMDRALRDGRSIANIVLSPIDRDGKMLNFFDVSARNGNYLLPNAYAWRAARGVRDPRDQESMYRLGFACVALGFSAVGLNLIRAAGLVPADDLDPIEAQVDQPLLFEGHENGLGKRTEPCEPAAPNSQTAGMN